MYEDFKSKNLKAQYIQHKDTGSFSPLIEDYLSNKEQLKHFYTYNPDEHGLTQAIEDRANYNVDRSLLVNTLNKQYAAIETTSLVKDNIALLANKHTFTVCTAHQPNLMTGYLYFFYKIIHAIKLANYLKDQHPKNNFVPVFYIGSEDNDLDELSVFRFRDKEYRWTTDQKGAVGRMSTKDLFSLLELLKKNIGTRTENAALLSQVITEAYEGQKTITDATRYLINAFLGKYGIVVLDADSSELKKSFLPILKEELFNPQALNLVKHTSENLNQQYKAQAYSRPINLFYLKDDIRERIEKNGSNWTVVNTNIEWNATELEEELNAFPERFSPNVILRGLYQESILPNVAFIGGGSEVAYWMQLKELFTHYKVFFPALILRQSAMWMNKKEVDLQEKLQLTNKELFLKKEILKKHFLLRQDENNLTLNEEKESTSILLEKIQQKAKEIDYTLQDSAAAVLAKINHQFLILEKKMLKAKKRKEGIAMQQIEDLKQHIFPNDSLQERYDSFLEFYLDYGPSYFETLLENTTPFGAEFLIIKSK